MEAQLSGLSARLRAVAECVPRGAAVADVGTDHAMLLAWLRARGRIAAGIGIDIAAGPLAQARRTLEAAAVTDVELRQGDGLAPLRPHEVGVVVLAGMGGRRMIQLVEAAPEVTASLHHLVLQPNTDWALVRGYVMARRFGLVDERMVEDRGKYYVVLVVDPRPRAAAEAWTEDELVLGPRLLQTRSPAFVAWLRHERARVSRTLAHVRAASRERGPRVVALQEHGRRVDRALAE